MSRSRKLCTLLFLFSLLLGVSSLEAVDVSTATGDSIRYKGDSGMAVIDGNAIVKTSSATLHADKISVYRNEKKGVAEGNVIIYQGTATITGSHAVFHWEASTGVVVNAHGVSPPWRFSADQLVLKSRRIYYLADGSLTSCNHDPPHFRIRSRQGKIIKGTRANMMNARLVVEDMPTLYTPFYTRSLVSKKWRLRVEPGTTSRDGITVKSSLGYPTTENSYSKLKWDYLQKTGNGIGLEHNYNGLNARGNLDTFYIRDHNSDSQPKSKRHTVLWNHYQRLSTNLTMNSKLDVKSDQTFGNQFDGTGNRVRVENSERGLFSEGGLRYQFPKATIEMDVNRRDRFDDTVSSNSFISKLTLPRFSFNTIPLQSKIFPFYTSFSGFWVNETINRSNPGSALQYQRSAQARTSIRKDYRIAKKWTVTPRLGFSETWQDRDLSISTSTKDVYRGRYDTGLDLRRRLFRLMDLTLAHRYVARLEANRMDLDTKADDRGIETNQMNASVVARVGRNTRVSVRSGYVFLDAPRNDLTRYKHQTARIIAPSADIQYQLTKNIGLFFRETYSLFNSAENKIVRTPANTSGEIQWGNIASKTFFSQGFSYAKGASGADSILNMSNKIKFYLTRKWYIDAFLGYRAVGPDRLNYSKFQPIEKTIQVVRDLHCWVLRASFSDRLDRKEASFYIDLKVDKSSSRDLFRESPPAAFYQYPYEEIDTDDLFEDPVIENIDGPISVENETEE